MQDAGEGDGGRRGIDWYAWETAGDQFQRPGVVSVGVGDQDDIRAAGLVDLAQVCELIACQAPAGLGRRADASIYEQAFTADFKEQAAGADFVRATQESSFYRRDLFAASRSNPSRARASASGSLQLPGNFNLRSS